MMLSKEDKIVIRNKCLELIGSNQLLTNLSKEDATYLVDKLIETKGERLERRKLRNIEKGWKENPFDMYLKIVLEDIEDYLDRTDKSANSKSLAHYFKIKDFEKRLGEVEDKIDQLKIGQKKEAKELGDELNYLVDEMMEEVPELYKRLDERINEINGDLIFILTDGQAGSVRKTFGYKETKEE